MTGKHTLGWIGMGRMGYPMAERLLKAGHKVDIWNARGQSRAACKPGAHRRAPADLAGAISSSSWLDGQNPRAGAVRSGWGIRPAARYPKIVVDAHPSPWRNRRGALSCRRLGQTSCGAVSGNARCGGKPSAVVSGPSPPSKGKTYMLSFAPRGGLTWRRRGCSRVCKIAHNVMLGVVIQNLAEITILAQKRRAAHAFLEFRTHG